MDDISAAVIASISHGHAETLLHLGLKPDGVPDADARVVYDSAVSLLREKKKVNLLALMVRSSGKLQNIESVKSIFSLNGTGDVPPEDVVKRVRDNYLQAEVDKLTKRASELRGDKTKEISLWLPIFAQKLQSLTIHARAYDPRPSAHRGPIVPPILFKSKLKFFNKMTEGNAGDGGGHRAGWWTVWVGESGRGKTSTSYTLGCDAVEQQRRVTFISKENQQQVASRLLLGLTHLTLNEVNSGVAKAQPLILDEHGSPLIVYDSTGNAIGEWHDEKVRQFIYQSWVESLDVYGRVYSWKYFSQIRNVISWDDPDLLIIDYIGPEDMDSKKDLKYALGAFSADCEEMAHTTRKSLHGNFQMSNQEALAYQKDPRHIVPGPYGSGAVRHSADQSFQTRIADIPDHQHYLKTKCRAGGLVEEYEAYYDKSRWIYTDLPERLPL